MASLYMRDRSPFWWIKFHDPVTAKVRRCSTGFRHGYIRDRQKAELLCAERTLAEKRFAGFVDRERWKFWVTPHLDLRYATSPKSRRRYEAAWRMLEMFLVEHQILYPRQLKREHCSDYMAWRKQPNSKLHKYRAGSNTARFELKLLGIIMKEAVLRGYAAANPCRELGIHLVKPAEKPAFTDAEMDFIHHKIKEMGEPLRSFLEASFLLGRYHGVRISETHFNPLEMVQVLRRATNGIITAASVTFHAKGGQVRCLPLHRKLLPLFTRLIEEGRTETYPAPKSASKEWTNFLDRIGIRAAKPGACFHSLRVTGISKCARDGKISEFQAMKYFGHASTTVHRMYVRLRHEDFKECARALE
jgi:integrase